MAKKSEDSVPGGEVVEHEDVVETVPAQEVSTNDVMTGFPVVAQDTSHEVEPVNASAGDGSDGDDLSGYHSDNAARVRERVTNTNHLNTLGMF